MNWAHLLARARAKSPLFWWRTLLAVGAAAFSLLLILQPAPWQVLARAGGMENFGLTENVFFWTWWAGLGSMVIMAGLFLLAPWWTNAPAPQIVAPTTPRVTPRWFWPLVLGAVVACGGIAAPTLNHSLWDDENESLAHYSLGRFVRDGKDAKVRFKAYPWRRTVFSYNTPNNHVFHNILSRASNGLWRAVTRPRGLQFHHVAVRLPAFLAALGGVAALAFLLKDFGYPAGGVAAAWFLALHPWFTEHAAAARGYTLVMLLALLAVFAWRRALQQGKWIWWFAFAIAQFLALWTYPGSLFIFAPLNLATALLIITRSASTPALPVRTQLSRWFCVNSITAAGLLPLILPLVMQLQGYTEKNSGYSIGMQWITDTAWCFVGGAPWNRNSASGSGHQDMQLVVQSLGTTAPWITAAVVAVFFLIGLLVFARRSKLGLALVCTMLAAPVLQFLYARWETIHMWHWYVIHALPFLALFWGVGLAASAGWLARTSRQPWLLPATITVTLTAFIFLNHPVHAWQLAHSKTPHRESVLATRPNPGDYRSEENLRIITFGHVNPAWCYDPNLLRVRSPAEIILLCRQADREGRPLMGNIGHPHVTIPLYPRDFAILEDRRLFGHVEKFAGADYVWDRYVYFYTPGALANVDLSEFLNAEEIAFVEQYAGMSPEKFFASKERPAPGGKKTSESN